MRFTLAGSTLLSVLSVPLAILGLLPSAFANGEETKVPVTIAGGHEIGQQDFGRPIALIAGALGVKPEVFRAAFSGVTPARGRAPSGGEARQNKSALLKVLSPHGVTNERLDDVSDYYRFQPQRGERWPTTPAKAHAIVQDGQVKRVVVTEGGSGYCSEPQAKLEGIKDAQFKVTLSFSKDFKTNGAISAIDVVPTK